MQHQERRDRSDESVALSPIQRSETGRANFSGPRRDGEEVEYHVFLIPTKPAAGSEREGGWFVLARVLDGLRHDEEVVPIEIWKAAGVLDEREDGD
jgi:hypothetical protein